MDRRKLIVAFAAVGAGMVGLFTLPSTYFVPATFAVTTEMMVASVWVHGVPSGRKVVPGAVARGVVSAVLLYALFYAGNAAIGAVSIPGLGKPAESSIYSLIVSPANSMPIQVALLAFDAAGYELFFRRTLQEGIRQKLGAAGAPLVGAADAALHIATLNPLWVATTFVADTFWGLTYHYAKGIQASFTSHLVWDVVIFLIAPIR